MTRAQHHDGDEHDDRGGLSRAATSRDEQSVANLAQTRLTTDDAFRDRR